MYVYVYMLLRLCMYIYIYVSLSLSRPLSLECKPPAYEMLRINTQAARLKLKQTH